MYSEKIMNLFANPNNVGILQSASGIGVYTNEKTNEIYKLYLKIENNFVVNASFKAYTGVVGIALMSVFTDMLKNKSIENLSKVEAEDILKELGRVGKKYEYLADDAIESLKLAVTDYQKKLEKEEEKNSKKKAKEKK